MKKKLLYVLTLFMFTGLTGFAQNPVISNFSYYDDSCFYTGVSTLGIGSITDATPGVSMIIYWGDGTSSNASIYFSVAPPASGPNASFQKAHNYAFPGTYTGLAVLFNAAGMPIDSSQTTINAFCYYVTGNIYKRNDANCTFDANIDNLIYNFQQIEVRKNNIPIDTFTANGAYVYAIPQMDLTSEFSFYPINMAGYQMVCPIIAPYKIRMDTLNGVNNIMDYGYECTPGNSFNLFAYMSGMLRFVNNSYLTITTGNSACVSQSGIVTLNIDSKYNFASSVPAPATANGQVVTWDFNNLSGNFAQNIYVTLHPADTLTPGDTSCHTVTITPTTGDINQANNTYNFCDTIRASFDPNEKKVSPMGDISAGQLLTYTINFENLGNDTAFNIHVIDTLSSNLEPSSFEILASSHHINTNLFDYGTTKIVRFDFNDINLEDKDHPDSNKGFIIYQAKAKADLTAGDAIENTAHIFFDINPAIITNTVVSKIPDPTGVHDLAKPDGLKIYPNPAKNSITIENQNGLFNQVRILNTLGQLVKETNLKTGANKVDVAAMNAGIYYLLISGKNGNRSIKFVKE